MKKVICMVLILLAVCVVLVGCGELTGTITGKQDVKIQIGDGDAESMDIISAWNKANESDNLNKDIVITLQRDVSVNQRLVLDSAREGSFTVDLNGKTLHRNLNAATNNGEVICINGTGNYVFKNGTVSGGWNNNRGGAVCVNASAANSNVTFEKIEISGNRADIGAGVYVAAVPSGKKSINIYLVGKVIISDNEGKTQGEDLVLGYSENSELMPFIQSADKMASGSQVYIALEGNKTGVFTATVPTNKSSAIAGYFKNETYQLDRIRVTDGDQIRLAKGTVFKFDGAVATLKLEDDYLHYYKNFADAMEDAYLNETAKQKKGTITLLKDLVLESKLNPGERSAELTFDLNNFTISRNLTGYVAAGEVICINKTGIFIFQNGTITGGKNQNFGAGVWIESCNAQVTLKNITVTGNETTKACGAGISLMSNADGKMSKLTLTGKVIVKNNISKAAGYNDGNDILLWKCDSDSSKDAVLYVDGLTEGSDIYVQMGEDNLADRKITAIVNKNKIDTIATYIHNYSMLSKQYKSNDNNCYVCFGRTSDVMNSDAVASVKIGSKVTYFKMLIDPWKNNEINSAWDYICNNTSSEITLTLLQNAIAPAEMGVEKARTGALTIDLGGYTVTRTDAGNGSGAVFYFGNNGTFTLKNGTVTGGNDTDVGGGICVAAYEKIDLTLKDLTVTGNRAACGGGIYIDDSNNKMGKIKFVGKVVITGNTSNDADESDLVINADTRWTDNVIDVSGLTDGSAIKIAFANPESAVKQEKSFTSAIADKDIERIASYFTCDNYYVSAVSTAGGKCLCLSRRSVFKQSGAMATIQFANEPLYYYATFDEAMNVAYANDIAKQKDVTITLKKDLVLESKFSPAARSGKFTLDLGGNTIRRNLTNCVNAGEVVSLINKVDFVLCNGTVTGGKNNNYGAGIWIQNTDSEITLKDIVVTGNESAKNCGAGIALRPYNEGVRTRVTLEGVVVIDGNKCAVEGAPDVYFAGYGDINADLTSRFYDISKLKKGSKISVIVSDNNWMGLPITDHCLVEATEKTIKEIANMFADCFASNVNSVYVTYAKAVNSNYYLITLKTNPATDGSNPQVR